MNAQRKIRQGEIYWLDNCQPLHGDVAKRRPVVVVGTLIIESKAGKIAVVACTSTVYQNSSDAIELPNRSKIPQTHSGLEKRTWAIPNWFVFVTVDRLEDRIGYVSGPILRRIVAEFAVHLEQKKARLRSEQKDEQ